jgi:uncharacterized protein (TIGR04255 family)
MDRLPDFENPPVIETALGVRFAPLDRWSIPYFGLFWNTIKGRYPYAEVNPPLAPDPEIETGAPLFGKPDFPRLEIVSSPPVRCWFLNESKTELIQLQNDRLIHNWRKVSGSEPYPHHETTRPAFERDWKVFCEFLSSQDLGTPSVKQCEVTYVNHIDRGQGWESFNDLPKVFPCWAGATSSGFLPSPESVSFQTSYLMPEGKGRLHIVLVHAIRQSDAKETLQLTLLARGNPVSGALPNLLEWLDAGREWIVRGFTDFTSENMHRIWRRIR